MLITKMGTRPEDREWTGKCELCGTEAVFTYKEMKLDKDLVCCDGIFYGQLCWVCGNLSMTFRPAGAPKKITAYRLSLSGYHFYMYAGTTPTEAAECLKNELESGDHMHIAVEAYETTQDEIDSLEYYDTF